MDQHQKNKLDGLLNFLEGLFKFGKKTIIFLIIFGFIITIISSLGGVFGSKYFNGNQNSPYYQTYKGPILSLTLAQKIEGIKTSRELTLDFSPWKKHILQMKSMFQNTF